MQVSRKTVYGHILAGGVYQWKGKTVDVSPKGDVSWNESSYEGGGFATALGGGLDVDINDKTAIRVTQVDWIPILQDGSWIANTMRFGCGVIIRSGKQAESTTPSIRGKICYCEIPI